jgi:hypothetical protein
MLWLIAGLFFFFGPPALACRAVLRFPDMARLVGAVLATWQLTIFVIPAIVVLTAMANLPPLPPPKPLGRDGWLVFWLVPAVAYVILSFWLWLRYGSECQNARRDLRGGRRELWVRYALECQNDSKRFHDRLD